MRAKSAASHESHGAGAVSRSRSYLSTVHTVSSTCLTWSTAWASSTCDETRPMSWKLSESATAWHTVHMQDCGHAASTAEGFVAARSPTRRAAAGQSIAATPTARATALVRWST